MDFAERHAYRDLNFTLKHWILAISQSVKLSVP